MQEDFYRLPMTHSWRDHPKLKHRFHPDAPDDVQVLVHDGGPRLSDRRPESVWVTVTGVDSSDVFTGRLLNQPHGLESIAQGSEIKFVAPSGEHLLMVTEKYISERRHWIIEPCNNCGLDELFDAPSDLIRVIFPDTAEDDTVEMFSSFCGVCGGIQVLQHVDSDLGGPRSRRARKSKWWQFWK